MGLFWKFRIQFLSEARFFAVIDKKLIHGGIFEKLGTRIDEVGDIKFSDHTPWSKGDYKKVSSKKQYDKPSDYFVPGIAQKIKEAHSLQASMYWVRTDSKRKGRSDAKNRALNNIVLLRWLTCAIMYFFLIIVGLFTAGWTWPKNLRKKVLAVGIRKDE